MELNNKNVQSISIQFNIETEELEVHIQKKNGTKVSTSITNPHQNIMNLLLNTSKVALSMTGNDKETEQNSAKVSSENASNIKKLHDLTETLLANSVQEEQKNIANMSAYSQYK